VVYAAKSTDDESGSIQSQTAEVMAAIEHEGGRYVHGCPQSDERFSGYTGSRGPGLAEAIRLAEEAAKEHGEAELWGFDPDRFARGDGRRARHLGGLLFALWEKGVELRCIEGDDDLRDPIRAVLRGERNRQDSEAKSNARNIVSHVESCFTQEQDYQNCTNSAQDLQDSGIPLGTSGGEVDVTSSAANSYKVVGTSKSGNTFTITKTAGNFVKPYTCATAAKAGCGTGGKW